MPRITCFAEGIAFEANQILTLSKEESHHLSRVLRVQVGHSIYLLNGCGCKAQGLVQETGKSVTVKIEKTEVVAPPRYETILVQAIPKAKGMDGIVRKATEIGVSRIIPVVSDHCEVKWDAAKRASRQSHWKTIALEACKQSGNSFLPEIEPVISLDEYFERVKVEQGETLSLVGSLEPGAQLLATYMQVVPSEVKRFSWLIGPEGDFSKAEYESARMVGISPVSFSSHILRVETASTYAMSILDYELQQL